MSETLIDDLLDRWEEARERGEAITPEALCRDHPDLLETLRSRIAALEQLDRVIDLDVTARFAPPPPAEADGVKVPGYEVLGLLGRGGMGVVYKARHVALGRTVALKMILAGSHAGPDELTRFRKEAEAVARLQHPGIVQIFDVGEHGGLPYFSLEFCEGGTLSSQLNGTPLPPTTAAGLVEELAEAVQVAHEAGIIHRDLKPANVLLGTPHSGLRAPKITDFGLAKKLDEAGQTQSGAVMGTPSYMAPEQARGQVKGLGPATDVYALGAILYECLTGRPPFRAETPLETVLQVIGTDPVPPRQLNPKVPCDLETICLKCLHKEPGRRYASAHALAEDLRRFLDGKPVLARPVGRLARAWRWARRNPALAGALMLAAVFLVAGLAVSLAYSIDILAKNVALGNALEEKDRNFQRYVAEQAAKERFANVSAGMYLERGQALAERDGPEHGLPWIAQGLRLAPEGADAFVDRARRYLAAWSGPVEPIVLPHSTPVIAAGFSLDGKRLATAGEDRIVRVWDTETGDLLGKPITSPEAIASIALAPDGRLVAVGGAGSARLWDVETGKPAGEPLVESAFPQAAQFVPGLPIHIVGFSRDGKTVLTGSNNGLLRWETATGKPAGRPLHLPADPFIRPDAELTALAAFPEATTLFGTRMNGADLADTVKEAASRRLPFFGRVAAAALSGDGKRCLTAGARRSAQVWDAATGDPIGPLLRHPEKPLPPWTGGVVRTPAVREQVVLAGSLSADGSRAFTATSEEARWWDVKTGSPVGAPLAYPEADTVAVSPDGRLLLVSDRNRVTRLWPTEPLLNQPGPVPLPDRGELTLAGVVAGGQVVTTGNLPATPGRGAVHVLKAGENDVVRLPLHVGSPLLLAVMSPDGLRILTATADRRVGLWDLKTDQTVFPPREHPTAVTALAFSPDGKRFLTAREGHFAQVWDAATGNLIATTSVKAEGLRDYVVAGLDDATVAVAFRADGKSFATVTATGLRAWDAQTGAAIEPPNQPPGVSFMQKPLAVSPDGKTVLTVGGPGSCYLLDLETGRQTIRPLPPALVNVNVRPVALAPNGSRLAVASTRYENAPGGSREVHEVRVWDTATGAPVGEAMPHPGLVTVMAFSPDGKQLRTGAADGTCRAWDAGTGKALLDPFSLTNGPLLFLGYGPDGKTVLASGGDPPGSFSALTLLTPRQVQTFDKTGKPAGKPFSPGQAPLAWFFAPDGQTLATVERLPTGQPQACIWDMHTSKLLHRPATGSLSLLTAAGLPCVLAYAPDGRTLALTGEEENSVQLWSVADGSRGPALRHPGPVVAVAFSPDAKHLVTGGPDGRVVRWDLETGKPQGEPVAVRGEAAVVAVSPGGKRVLVEAFERGPSVKLTMQLFDGKTRQPVGPARASERLHSLAGFTADGAVLFTVEQPEQRPEVRLWDAATGAPLGPAIRSGDQMVTAAIEGGALVVVSRTRGRYLERPGGLGFLTGALEVRRWPLPTPLAGEADRLATWAQTVTGLELEATGSVRALGLEELQKRRRRLR